MIIWSFLNLWFTLLLGVLFLASQGSTKPLDGREDSLELHKRTDLNTLYNSVPGSNKVPLGGAQAFTLDLTKSAAYTTAYFYGCTVVITVDGNGIIIGHFAQEQPQPGTNGQQSCIAMTNAAVVNSNIIPKLVDAELMADGTDNTHAWILTSSGTATAGYGLIQQNLVDNGVPSGNINPYPYAATSAFNNFSQGTVGKAVVEVVPKPDGSGATINVYIQSDTPTWSQDYDCNGNPVTTTKQKKRAAAACAAPGSSAQFATLGPITPAPAGPTPACSQQQQDPDEGVTSGYCVCTLSGTTKTGSLLSVPTTAMATAACAYPTLPGSAITPSVNLGPATTNSALCEICTPVVNNEDSCSTITNCLPEAAQATVQVGSSPVHVGTLTSSALYTAISSALDVLCPTVSQTQSMTSCTTDTVTIGDIPYSDGGDGGPLETDGELVVKVAASAYNVTSLRNAMINSAALTAMQSAMGSTNCYTAHYTVEELRKRSPSLWSPVRRFFGLEERDHPYPQTESATWCNAASFAGVQYYDQFWRLQPTPGSTDYIDASWEFQVGPGGDFICEFITDLIDALGAVEPEFAVEDVELGKEIQAACTEAMDHA